MKMSEEILLRKLFIVYVYTLGCTVVVLQCTYLLCATSTWAGVLQRVSNTVGDLHSNVLAKLTQVDSNDWHEMMVY